MTIVSVVRDKALYVRLVRDNAFLSGCRVVALDNSVENETIPRRYNGFVASDDFPDNDWVAFVHEDFEFLEDPRRRMAALDQRAIYGVAGVTESGRAVLAILNSAKDGSGLVFSGCPYAGPREVSTLDCMCLIVHSSLVRRLGLRFDENLSFDLYAEVFSAEARERHGIRTYAVPIGCRHWSFGSFGDRFRRQLEYVRGAFARARHTYCSTTMESFGVRAGPLDRRRVKWGRNDFGPFRVKMSEKGVLKIRFLGVTVFRRDYRIAERVRWRILAVVHVFYPAFWPELRACLANITDAVDLVVTYADEASVAEVRRDVPQARFVKCENRGFDVWPFLKVLQETDLSPYDAVVKLHTKRDFDICEEGWINRCRMNGSAWRRHLLSFVASGDAWQKTRRLLSEEGVGMAADWRVIVGRESPGLKMYRDEYDEAARDMGLAGEAVAARGRYVAGTMFAARPSSLAPLLSRRYEASMFDPSVRDGGEQLAHRIERQLGLAAFAAGFRVVPWNGFVPLRRLAASVNKFVRRELLRGRVTRT